MNGKSRVRKDRSDEEMDDKQADMCRVCRSEGSQEKPLYHPCVCTGSIKYIHQECLVQWLKYSKKEYCELCKHRYTFTPIYAPDMPKRLPIQDIIGGLLRSVGKAVRFWLHYTLVAIAWLGIVPLTACRIYRCLFTGSVSSLLTLPLDMLSTENLLSDCFQGCFVVTCTLCTFISLVWLREQILHGGGPDWLEHDLLPPNNNARQNVNVAADNDAAGGGVAAPAADQQVNGEAQGNVEGDIGEGDVEGDEEEADEDHAENEDNGNVANNEENNWNPMEWERAAEELTWERLLGLDGSLLFMEHVFWVVSLNTLFIILFAFCPYHIGHFTVLGLKAQEMLTATKFEGLLTTFLGYLIIASSLAVLHLATNLVDLKRFRRILGLCYIAIKVSLLVVMEIIIFPLICGWWLDICSLSMFDATLKDREHSFQVAPGTSMFIHWLVGMVYIFYFASFILLLREVLRPGVLWFLRNLNDPDFNPIQEMIHLPVHRHIRRFLASMVVFGSIVLVMLWLPIQVIQKACPAFLPFHVMLSSPDTPVSELSLELLLLQVVLPALLEQGHTRHWLKGIIRGWCIAVAWLLNLRSYLLGDVPLAEEGKTAVDMAAEDAAASVPEVAPVPPLNEDPEPVAEQVDVEDAETGPELSEPVGQSYPAVSNDTCTGEEPVDGSGEEGAIEESEMELDVDLVRLVDDITDEADSSRTAGPDSARPESSSEGILLSPEASDRLEPVGAVPGVPEQEGERDANEEPALATDEHVDVDPLPAVDNDPPVVEAEPAAVPPVPPQVNRPPQGLGDAHQAMMQGGGPTGFQPYNRPDVFPLRLLFLVFLMCLTFFLASLILFLVPVYVGRKLMSLWTGEIKVHELYTAACGLYTCWVALRIGLVLYTWIPLGWRAITNKLMEWTLLVTKSVFIAVVLIGIIPLLLGLIFELVIVIPIRVPIDQTPVFFPWQDWALGVLHAKIITAATLMGPQWRLKRVIEQVYNQGLRNMDLKFVMVELCLPVLVCLGLLLTLPYIVAKSVMPVIGFGFEVQNLILRRIYPFLLSIFLLISFCVFQARQFRHLYEHIKNDKYLVGQRLVNYERRA